MIFGGTVLGIAHDPGGARVVAPILLALHQLGHPVVLIGSGPSTGICNNEFPGLCLREIEDSASLQTGIDLLKEEGAQLLVSASGLYNEIEHTMRLAANSLGLPIVGVLDWYFNMRQRFQRVERSSGCMVDSRPDWVLALDEPTKKEVIQAGFQQDQIHVAGYINLEHSLQKVMAFEKDLAGIRGELGIPASKKIAVFFSEPYINAADGKEWGGVGGYFDSSGHPIHGYTAAESLQAVLSAMESLEWFRHAHLVVKAHPMEHVPALMKVMSRLPEDLKKKMTIVEKYDPAKLIALGSIFFGMASVALLEASITGKPVLSVQIGLNKSPEDDPCISNRLGLSISIRSLECLKNEMAPMNLAETPTSGNSIPSCMGSSMAAAQFLEQKFLQEV